MGEVWLARHALLARPAAVKLIRKQAMEVEAKQQDTLRARFQREARATARLRSPNTVELYDFGVSEDGSFYYVMEYLTGVDLHRLVEKYGVLPPARAIHLLSQACLSLAEAHEVGLVHRDIKPSNLFICKLGSVRDVVKVLDFGVVRLTKGQDHLVTATGQLSGTPASMAPELVAGTQADPAADIYGLGCVAYWLLTGRPVFDAPNLMALMMQHATKVPEPPSVHNPSVPSELDAIVLQCLEKTPEARPVSVIELRKQLLDVPLAETWGEAEAASWWREHLPDSQGDGSAEQADLYGETVDYSPDAQLDTKLDDH
jgi:serine/threonine-protein kinase